MASLGQASRVQFTEQRQRHLSAAGGLGFRRQKVLFCEEPSGFFQDCARAGARAPFACLGWHLLCGRSLFPIVLARVCLRLLPLPLPLFLIPCSQR